MATQFLELQSNAADDAHRWHAALLRYSVAGWAGIHTISELHLQQYAIMAAATLFILAAYCNQAVPAVHVTFCSENTRCVAVTFN